MSARDDLLREAKTWENILRSQGYLDAEVMPEYCITPEIGMDRIFTKTICVYAGKKYPKPPSRLQAWCKAVKDASCALVLDRIGRAGR